MLPSANVMTTNTAAIAALLLASACSGTTSMSGDPIAPPSPFGNQQIVREPVEGTARLAPSGGAWGTPEVAWRAALKNYEPVVRLDNTTSLGAGRVPFAMYLVSMHNRIHPVFAEAVMALADRPKSHPMNDPKLSTSLEIILDKNTGRIVRMGVTRSSGVPEFDTLALRSVDRAQPFGASPDAIASPDGRVYLQWDFHRDPVDGCTVRNARPYMLAR